jgi:DNA-binding transcriptional MerR regulator
MTHDINLAVATGSRRGYEYRGTGPRSRNEDRNHPLLRAHRPPARATSHTGELPDYSVAHVSRLTFARRARDLGFSIEKIRALLDLADHKEQSCEAVDAIAREHLADVKRKLADLSALRRELESMIGQCRHGTVAECRILEALAPDPARR